MKITEKITVTNEDNMELMARYPDGYFDLAIVDPPYGIGASEMQMGLGKKKWNKGKKWDSLTPDNNYFKELFRVSNNQIIWGGNHFALPISRGWIFWDKDVQPTLSFSSGELAWSSFDLVLKKAFIEYSGFRGKEDEKIHPTQKPIALYKWLLDKYAKQGDKILDTHLGSGSIAIACHDYGFELTACELDTDYYNASIERIKRHVAFNQSLFSAEEFTQQKTLFQ
ncbi:DNA methyltransferase [Chryseobacterium culicis]|uniref:DNA methyltransferase n=1 Tax=Chryseobacterium culicis TaxID=680127 RepID=UPI001876CF0D|nr:DNA methyltransferase [Chryseobacterium culicis]MBE4949943.1 site-specific DNA-methyltransferase [Chryseobacterium culicis]